LQAVYEAGLQNPKSKFCLEMLARTEKPQATPTGTEVDNKQPQSSSSSPSVKKKVVSERKRPFIVYKLHQEEIDADVAVLRKAFLEMKRSNLAKAAKETIAKISKGSKSQDSINE